MNIEIQRNETSHPIFYTDIDNAYTKGQLYCIRIIKAGKITVHKYPLCSIFRIIET